MTIAIIDYGSGNLRSAQKAFERVAAAHGPQPVLLTDKAEDIAAADHIILPGVGAFGDCAAGLRALPGMEEALRIRVLEQGRPFLGICVGMQLLATTGLEHGQHDGLGWIDGQVDELTPKDKTLKIPHMGWNELVVTKPHPVLDGLENRDVYFVHSYALRPAQAAMSLAEVDYGGRFCAVAGTANIIGTQFHPEKSQQVGLALIRNFLEWRP